MTQKLVCFADLFEKDFLKSETSCWVQLPLGSSTSTLAKMSNFARKMIYPGFELSKLDCNPFTVKNSTVTFWHSGLWENMSGDSRSSWPSAAKSRSLESVSSCPKKPFPANWLWTISFWHVPPKKLSDAVAQKSLSPTKKTKTKTRQVATCRCCRRKLSLMSSSTNKPVSW